AACSAAGAPEPRPSGSGGVRGADGVGDPLFPSLGNGGYDVEHYALTLDWDPGGNRLAATAVITAHATQRLSAFNLDLHGLTVRSATVDGTPAATARDGDELTVTPATVLAEGREFTTTIVYDGVPQTVTDPDGSREGWLPTDDGAVALGEPAGSASWFPGNHTPADKAVYDIAVTVPRGLTAVSNGFFAGSDADADAGDGRDTFRWQNTVPTASYLVFVAIGRFEVTQGSSAGLPSYIAVDPREASDTTRALPGLIDRVLAWGGGRFGWYPFPATGAVVDRVPELGYALETQSRPFFDHAPEPRVVVHELAHQWFGNAVGPRTWQDMWLNEGFATYAEWLWDEDHGGPTTRAAFEQAYDTSGPAGEGIWAFPPADPGKAANITGAPVYQRGAMVLQKVREAVGDELFFDILRAWTDGQPDRTGRTADFTALCERLCGLALDAVFGPWLFEDGKPPRD
ncbi:MAG: M1 family metallopeptidase, partial [Streptomycetaceae bacterium]|nr:M1 family metallopeptidase [Streptomycetaceae bacterium]